MIAQLKSYLVNGVKGYNDRGYHPENAEYALREHFPDVVNLFETRLRELVKLPTYPAIEKGINVKALEGLVGNLAERDDAALGFLINGSIGEQLFRILASTVVEYDAEEERLFSSLVDDDSYQRFTVMIHNNYETIRKTKKGIVRRLSDAHRLPIFPNVVLKEPIEIDAVKVSDVAQAGKKIAISKVGITEVIYALQGRSDGLAGSIESIKDAFFGTGVDEPLLTLLVKHSHDRGSLTTKLSAPFSEYEDLLEEYTNTIRTVIQKGEKATLDEVNTWLLSAGKLNEWLYTSSAFRVVQYFVGKKMEKVMESIIAEIRSDSVVYPIAILVDFMKTRKPVSLDPFLKKLDRATAQFGLKLGNYMATIWDKLYSIEYNYEEFYKEYNTPIKQYYISEGDYQITSTMSTIKTSHKIQFNNTDLMAKHTLIDGGRLQGDVGIVFSSKYTNDLIPEGVIPGLEIIKDTLPILSYQTSEEKNGQLDIGMDAFFNGMADALLLRGSEAEDCDNVELGDLIKWIYRDDYVVIGGMREHLKPTGGGILTQRSTAEESIVKIHTNEYTIQNFSQYGMSIPYHVFRTIVKAAFSSLKLNYASARTHMLDVEPVRVGKLIEQYESCVVYTPDLNLLANIKRVDMKGVFKDIHPRSLERTDIKIHPLVHGILTNVAGVYTASLTGTLNRSALKKVADTVNNGNRVFSSDVRLFLDMFFNKLEEVKHPWVRFFIFEYLLKNMATDKGAAQANVDSSTDAYIIANTTLDRALELK